MSYEDTNCPCGGKKERETMLCADCMKAFADTPDMKVFLDPIKYGVDARRPAAILLCAKARRRGAETRHPELAFAYHG
jgi:hypothetical protein